MTSPITATVVVEGDPPLLAGYRARVNALLDAEPSGPYRELHAAGRLDYRLKASGVPYPPFVAASAEFPELTVRVEWQNPVGGIGGSATIRAGKLVEQATASATEAGRALEVRAERDGTIALALATRRRRAGATVLEAADGAEPEWAERWTVRGDTAAYTALDPHEPLDDALAEALERLAHDFADEWLWFDAAPVEETAIERQRYADYGFAINPANLRAAKLRTVLTAAPGGGLVLEATEPEARSVVALVARLWLQAGRH
jgi:hypothetical protein